MKVLQCKTCGNPKVEQFVRSQAPTIGDVSSKLMMGIREIAICKDPICAHLCFRIVFELP